jgi:flagellar biosynthetic protein FlhB
MAETGSESQDRTEAATPRRLQRAREEGQVPLSRELTSFAVLGAAALVLVLVAPGAAHTLATRLAVLLGQAHQTDPVAALRAASLAGVIAAAPFVLAGLLAALGSVLLQTGFLFNPGALIPDLARLSPLAGLKRLFAVTTLLDAGKSVLKMIAAGIVLVMVIGGALPDLRAAVFWTPAGLLDHATRMLLHMLLAVLAVQAAVALADAIQKQMKHAADLRMSREDIRQEMRESEGDPQVKARLRQLRTQLARRRMMAAVPKATVVVTNPTHYAVALIYDRAAGGAPRVVAKGVDDIATRIRAVAEENKVPLVANPPLARALYRVELDAEIPAEHFQAVAEIIAYVWRLRGRAGSAGR